LAAAFISRARWWPEHTTDERGLVGGGRGQASPDGSDMEVKRAGNVREHT